MFTTGPIAGSGDGRGDRFMCLQRDLLPDQELVKVAGLCVYIELAEIRVTKCCLFRRT